MILPTGATSFAESLRLGIEVYHSLKDEKHTLEIIAEAIQNSGHAGRIDIGLDVAASEFYDAKKHMYNLSQKTGANDRIITPDALIDIYDNLSKKYPIVSI